MDYFQGVVTEFLRSKRTTFVNTEYMIQLDHGTVYAKGRHWFCDAVAIDHKDRTVHLCEVTYSRTQQSLVERLQAWRSEWQGVVAAIRRDSSLEGAWHFQAHVFVPAEYKGAFEQKIASLKPAEGVAEAMPLPIITTLEEVLPWMYRSWNGERYQSKTNV